MARDKDRIEKRNQLIMQDFYKLEKKQPKWEYSSYLEELADKYFLASATVSKILNQQKKQLI